MSFEKFLPHLKYQETLYLLGSLHLLIFQTECFSYYMSYYKATDNFVMHKDLQLHSLFTAFSVPGYPFQGFSVVKEVVMLRLFCFLLSCLL